MTIRETLKQFKQKQLDQLIEWKAPEQLIDDARASVEQEDLSIGIDKYGDLEVEKIKFLYNENPSVAPIVLFTCANINEILMYTRFLDEEPPQPFNPEFGGGMIFLPNIFRSQRHLVRLSVTI